ncbi:hypothetical protein HanRHA438_Chr08g0358821 [Helianthus annuus]|nr:hypothetical protein HanRHA438_Chr08g0358821 [Helianthus annuus]
MEIPFNTPKPMTALESKGLCSKNFIHNATCNEQNVTNRCQLVNVVAEYAQVKLKPTDEQYHGIIV